MLNKPLKIVCSDKQNCLFWGCTHIYHNPKWDIPIWKMRGYNSVEEHTYSIRNKINTLSPNDILFLLGDGFLNSSPDQVESFIFSLTPKIYYIWGNHESSTSKLYSKYKSELYPQLIEKTNIYPLVYKNITFLGHYIEMQINNQIIVLQHFPLKIWDKSKNGSYHIHSHNHGGLASSLPHANEGKILDVGVEVFPNNPVSFEEINKIMNKKNIKSIDLHH